MDPEANLSFPTEMKELIQYFETHGRLLDRQDLRNGASLQDAHDTDGFISCIRFNGVPILPPVMTAHRKEEAQRDRHNAAFKEKCRKARQQSHHMAVSSVGTAEASGPLSEAKHGFGKNSLSRLPLERPSVLKPVVSSAWDSVSADDATVAPVQSLGASGISAIGPRSINAVAIAEQEHEEFGLQTLESMGSDLVSMEEVLPTDFNGVPLTSVKEQKISQDLLRLSKVLKVGDCNSTGESSVSELPSSECSEDVHFGEVRNGSMSTVDNMSGSFFHESQDTVVEVLTENTTSGFVESSTDEFPANLSSPGVGSGCTNTSGMSSVNTTSTAESHRSSKGSPRSLKNNTVHFASFVTEYIDTSASPSSKNITVVKKKLSVEEAAKNAVRTQNNNKEKEMFDEGLHDNVSFMDPESPLNPTHLSSQPNFPYQSYSKADPSSSNKENDAKQANKLSGSSSLRLNTSQSQSQCNSKVTDSQGSSRSDVTVTTSESSNSTVVEDAALTGQSSVNSLPPNISGETNSERESQRKSDTAFRRKHKKLPPEPHQRVYQNQPSSEIRAQTANIKSFTEDEDHKESPIRHDSNHLSTPSPAVVHAKAAAEIHSESLNLQSCPFVPSESEETGKAEHINKYLSQVQLHSVDDATLSDQLAHLSGESHETTSQLQNSISILQSLSHSHNDHSSQASGDLLQEFQTLREQLVEQQQKELEELFIQQRREQMLLQEEIEEHQRRMKEHQDFLESNAPENIKVQSQDHDGELSPDSNSGEETGVKRFKFPVPKQMQVILRGQRNASSVSSPSDQLLLNNSASSASPKVQRLVLRSPMKFYPTYRNAGRVLVPPQAYEPEMKLKFEKLTAAGKGFLCRCLLRSDKVQELIKTIKDTREFAFSFQSETPIRRGNFSSQDRTLLERIVAQLQAALLDIHEIFFDTPVSEQMAFIEQTRRNNREKQIKSSTDSSMRSSGPRISTATLKAQERRRRAQEAENSASSSARPRTAPPSTNSPRSPAADLSGPSKLPYQQLLSKSNRAGAKHHSQLSQISALRSEIARLEKNRPNTAPERLDHARPRKPASSFVAANSNRSSENAQSRLHIRPKQQQSQGQKGQSGSDKNKNFKSAKSWR